jgi:hypothetical protein
MSELANYLLPEEKQTPLTLTQEVILQLRARHPLRLGSFPSSETYFLSPVMFAFQRAHSCILEVGIPGHK